jgi:hypothetical protein
MDCYDAKLPVARKYSLYSVHTWSKFRSPFQAGPKNVAEKIFSLDVGRSNVVDVYQAWLESF